MNEEDITELYQLDWIKILKKAIDNRPSSWNSDNPVREWRNASDEICMQVIRKIREHYNIPSELDKLNKEVRRG